MLHTLLRDKAGNFGIISALIMTPLVAVAGLAVDVSNAYSTRTHLQDAADAAALGAISERSPAVQEAFKMAADEVIDVGQRDALNCFSRKCHPMLDTP